MARTTRSKFGSGVVRTTGAGSVGVTGFAAFRIASAHPVPHGVWAAAGTLGVVIVLVTSLGLILDYQVKKLDIQARCQEAQTAAELQKIRLESYQAVLEKAAGEPERAREYRDLITADALHLSVEQNGVRLSDRTHADLYSARPVTRDGPP